jgi:hypothetical protein
VQEHLRLAGTAERDKFITTAEGPAGEGPTNPSRPPREEPLEFSVNAQARVMGGPAPPLYSEITAQAAPKASLDEGQGGTRGAANAGTTTPAADAGPWWGWIEAMTPQVQAPPPSSGPNQAAPAGLAGIPIPDIFQPGYNLWGADQTAGGGGESPGVEVEEAQSAEAPLWG